MPSPSAIPVKVSGDVFTLALYEQFKDDVNYVLQQGADLASAGTITVTNQYHKVTGTTTITNITAGVLAGQMVRLQFAAALTVQHHGGGSGNLRLQGSVDFAATTDAFLTFVWTGTVWQETSRSGTGASTVYRKLTEKDVVSSTTETDLFNGEITLAAGVLGSNKAAKIFAQGDILQNTGGAVGSPRWRLKLGTTTLIDTDTVASLWRPNANRGFWFLEAVIANVTASSQFIVFKLYECSEWDNPPNTQFATGTGDIAVRTNDSASGSAPAKLSTLALWGYNTSALDTSTSKLLEFTVQLPTSSASESVRLKQAMVEIV